MKKYIKPNTDIRQIALTLMNPASMQVSNVEVEGGLSREYDNSLPTSNNLWEEEE